MNRTRTSSYARVLTVVVGFSALSLLSVVPAQAGEEPGPACDLLAPEHGTVCIYGDLLGFIYNSNGLVCFPEPLTPHLNAHEQPGNPHSEVICDEAFCSFAQIEIDGIGFLGIVEGVAECGILTADCFIARPAITGCTDSNTGSSVGLRTCKTVVAGIDKQYTYECTFA